MMSKERLRRIRHVAIDLDGTIYTDGTVFPESLVFLEQLRLLGIGHTFVTNNASKNRADYVLKLSRMGIEVQPTQIYTSALATIEYLKANHPQYKRVLIVGTHSLESEFVEHGFEVMPVSSVETPDAVVVSFDPDLKFSQLCRASFWIEKQTPYFATHPDFVCPTKEIKVLIDCGSICAAIHAATGRKPIAVPGKPSPAMLSGVLAKHNLRPEELAMIGDRLYTDIAMANSADVLSVLVLTGECARADLHDCDWPPDVVVDHIGGFGMQLVDARHN